MLELLEKSGKNPFMLEEPFQNLFKPHNANIAVPLALSSNIGSSLGAFLRQFIIEIVNGGSTYETFLETSLKGDGASDLLEYYQCVKEMMEALVKLNDTLVESKKYWREHAKFYNELSKIVSYIPLTLMQDIYDMVTPSLLELMKRGPEGLK